MCSVFVLAFPSILFLFLGFVWVPPPNDESSDSSLASSMAFGHRGWRGSENNAKVGPLRSVTVGKRENSGGIKANKGEHKDQGSRGQSPRPKKESATCD